MYIVLYIVEFINATTCPYKEPSYFAKPAAKGFVLLQSIGNGISNAVKREKSIVIAAQYPTLYFSNAIFSVVS